MQEEQEKKPNPVVQRVKLIMVSGRVSGCVQYIRSEWVCSVH